MQSMAWFGLTSTATLALAFAALCGITLGTLVGWGWFGRFGRGAWPARAASLVACQLAAVLVTALALNDNFVFYQSWAELTGSHPATQQPATAAGRLDARWRAATRADYLAGRGTLATLQVPGAGYRVPTLPATVYLPPQYGDPAYAQRRFPVVELLDGFPGGPATWVRRLHVASLLDSLIRSGRSAPFVAVLPTQNVASPWDTECVDVPGGPQVDSYLSSAVHDAVARSFRVAGAGSQWTVLGYSTGGYCATDLALRHPGLFSAAASLDGYNAPAHDGTTGNLFHRDPAAAREFNATWLIRQPVASPVRLLLVSTRTDLTSYRAVEQLSRLAAPSQQLDTLVLPRGGHNFGTFAAELPAAFGWLSQWVATPLAQQPTVDGLSPSPGRPAGAGAVTATARRSEPARCLVIAVGKVVHLRSARLLPAHGCRPAAQVTHR